jgi:hypothetical protein
MGTKKVLIHQFNPEIYPYRIWVAITTDEEALKEYFNDYKNEELRVGDRIYISKAITCEVVKRETLDKGVLISFRNRKFMDASTITHESVHASSFLWVMMGEVEIGEEANGYLSGWIAGCCETVKNYKHG